MQDRTKNLNEKKEALQKAGLIYKNLIKSITYTEEPNGRLNMERYMRGLPAYAHIDLIETDECKIAIFAAYININDLLSHTSFFGFQQKLEILAEEYTEIYYWDGKNVIKTLKNPAGLQLALAQATPGKKSTILAAASQIVEVDRVMVFDDFELDNIFRSRYQLPFAKRYQIFYISKYAALSDTKFLQQLESMEREKITTLLAKGTFSASLLKKTLEYFPNLNTLHVPLYNFQSESYRVFGEYPEFAKQIHILEFIVDTGIENENLEKFLKTAEKMFPELQAVHFYTPNQQPVLNQIPNNLNAKYYPLERKEIPAVLDLNSSINLITPKDCKELQNRLLNLPSNTKNLTLNLDDLNFNNLHQMELPQLEQIQALYITNSCSKKIIISIHDLERILTCFPCLKKLELNQVNFTDTELSIPAKSLPFLESLKLHFSDKSTSYTQCYLLSFIQSNPQLLELEINFLNEQTLLEFESPVLPHLLKLSLMCNKLSNKMLNRFLTLGANTQILEMVNHQCNDSEPLQFPFLNNLKMFSFGDTYNIPWNPDLFAALGSCIPKELLTIVVIHNRVQVKDRPQWLNEVEANIKNIALREPQQFFHYYGRNSGFRVSADTKFHRPKPKKQFLTRDSLLNQPRQYREKIYNSIYADEKTIELCEAQDSALPHRHFHERELFSLYESSSDKSLAYREFSTTLGNGKEEILLGLSRGDQLMGISSSLPLTIEPLARGRYKIKLANSEQTSIQVDIHYLLKSKRSTQELRVQTSQGKFPAEFLVALLTMKFELDQAFHDVKLTRDWCLKNETLLQAMRNNEESVLHALVTLIGTFGDEELKKSTDTNNDWKLLEAIQTQKQGVCQHRTWLFLIYFFALKKEGMFRQATVEASKTSQGCHIQPEIQLTPHTDFIVVELYESDRLILEEKNDDNLPEFMRNRAPLQTNEARFSLLDSKLTWPIANSNEFFQQLSKRLEAGKGLDQCRPEATQALLFLPNPKELLEFHRQILRWMIKTQQNYFYIDHFSDITQRRKTKNGTRESRVFQWLDTAESGDWLIVHWPVNTMRADYTGFKSMMDPLRKMMEKPIKPGIKLLVFMLIEDYPKLREDFLSLFSHRLGLIIPVAPGLFLPPPQKKIDQEQKEIKKVTTSLYGSQEWYRKLIFSRRHTAEGQKKIPGFILQLILDWQQNQDNTPVNIVVYDPPHSLQKPLEIDHAFLIFWQTLEETRELFVEEEEKVYRLPDCFKLTILEGHESVPQEKYHIIAKNEYKNHDEILHPGIFPRFFSGARTHHGKGGYIGPGLIEKYKEKGSLTLLVIHSLTSLQWQELFAEAEKYQVTIHLVPLFSQCLLNLTRKQFEPLHTTFSPVVLEEKAMSQVLDKNAVIVTADSSFTLTHLKKLGKEIEVIAINQFMDNELLEYWTEVESKENEREPLLLPGRLLKKLRDPNKIIALEGEYSAEIQGILASLFLNNTICFDGEPETIAGKLIILTSNSKDFNFVSRYHHSSSLELSWRLAEEKYPSREVALVREFCQRNLLEVTSYAQILAMLQQLQLFPDKDPTEPWQLLNNVDFSQKWAERKYDEKVDEETERLQDIYRWTKVSPFLFLMGPSASGKSTLIEERFMEYLRSIGQKGKLWCDEKNFEKWAKHPKNKDMLHFLFIDEANMANPGEWDKLATLFNNPPTLEYLGKEYVLTSQHKIIFAGNQKRARHEVFYRYGAVYPYPCFTLDYRLKKHVLPVAEKCLPELKDPRQILAEFKTIYLWVEKNPTTKRMITTRNLQAMVLQLQTYVKKYPKDDQILDQAKRAGLAIAKDLLTPKDFLQLQKEIGNLNLPEEKTNVHLSHFVVTSLHHHSLNKLTNDLEIREARIANYQPLRKKHLDLKQQLHNQFAEYIKEQYHQNIAHLKKNVYKKYLREFKKLHETSYAELKSLHKQLVEQVRWGIRGILFEGPSGIGKSALTIEYLQSRGFKNALENPATDAPKYYHLSPMPYELMIEILIFCWNEGLILVVDELNTFRQLETLFNSLLMGKLNGKIPKKEGFYLIATQNPADFPGRLVLSAPLKNRMTVIELRDYEPSELSAILIARFKLAPERADHLVKLFLENKKQSILTMTLRNLFDLYYDSLATNKLSAPPLVRSLIEVSHIANRNSLFHLSLSTDINSDYISQNAVRNRNSF